MDFFDKLGDTLMTATKEVGQKAKGMSDLAKLQYELKCKEDDLKKNLSVWGENTISRTRTWFPRRIWRASRILRSL